jgi:hypothetical protein
MMRESTKDSMIVMYNYEPHSSINKPKMSMMIKGIIQNAMLRIAIHSKKLRYLLRLEKLAEK